MEMNLSGSVRSSCFLRLSFQESIMTLLLLYVISLLAAQLRGVGFAVL